MTRLGRATASRPLLPGARAGLSFLLLLLLLLSPLAARAAVYTFSGSNPGSGFPACSVWNGVWEQSGSTWTCNGSTSLAAGDSISPSGSITVVATAGITLGGNNAIGTASASVSLTTAHGNLTGSGSGSVFRGNLTAGSGSINLSNATVHGAVTGASGSITLTNVTVNGTVTKTGGGGSITITGGSITGAVSSAAGISASGGTVFGSSVTASGSISLTGGGSVAGNVSGDNGVTASGGVTFGGNVAASSGTISLTGGSVVGQVHSTCCQVATNNTNVGNGIRSDHNTVTINGGTVSGAIYSSGGGGIVINNATIPSGSVITSNVAININGSTLGSSASPVDVSSNNVVNVNNSTVYGNVTAGNWPSALIFSGSSSVIGVCTSNTNSIDQPPNYPYCASGEPPVTIAHYAITFPDGTSGVTCEALKVRVTAHDSSHNPVNPANGTTITVSANNGGSIVSGSGGSTHTFGGSDSQVDFWLTKTTPGVVNVNVSEGARTESATEDPNATFADAVFRVYACSGTPSLATCGDVLSEQIAGKSSNHAPGARNLYLRAIRTDAERACTSGLQAGSNVIEFGYECNEPATCTDANLMTVAGTPSANVARNASGGISATSGTYTDVTLNFDGNGYAPFTLRYDDAGSITLHARKALAATAGPPALPAVTIHGATTFHVRPFALLVDVPGNPKGINPGDAKFKAAGEGFNVTVRGVVWEGDDDKDSSNVYDGLPQAGANLADNATTENFAWETKLKVDTAAGSFTPSATDGGVTGALKLGSSAATFDTAAFRVAGSEGVASATNLNYSEVGSFTLLTEATGYLDQSDFNVSALPVVVGRFVPHHFGVTGTLRTRSDISLAPGGTASTFTYMSEPMQVMLAVTAYNQANVETKNYVKNFAKLDRQTLGNDLSGEGNWARWTAALGLGAVAVSGTTNLSDRLVLDEAGANSAAPTNTTTEGGSTSGWLNGKSHFRFNLIFARKETAGVVAPDGPYHVLKVGAKPLDADGVTLPPYESLHTDHCVNLDVGSSNESADCKPGTTESTLVRKLFETDIRFGRLRLTNAYGSVSPLKVPVEAQYWSSRSWVLNGDDSLTSLSAFPVLGWPCDPMDKPGPEATLAGGRADIGVTAKSSGTCTLTLDLSGAPWLQGNWGGNAGYTANPSAKVTFGVFSPEHKRTIYIRELY